VGLSSPVRGLSIRSDGCDGPLSPSGSSPKLRGASRSHRTEPFLIGVAGGTASGKTTVCDHIMQRLHGKCIHIHTLIVLSGSASTSVITLLHCLSSFRCPSIADQCVVMLSQDSFYRGLTPEEKADVKSTFHLISQDWALAILKHDF